MFDIVEVGFCVESILSNKIEIEIEIEIENIVLKI